MLGWVESTAIAATIRESVWLTAALSAAHLLGMTLLVGGALVSALRLTGVVFADRPVVELGGTVSRAMSIGLLISVVTGFLLFMPRASAAAVNGRFQVKMVVLAAAICFHLAIYRPLLRRTGVGSARPAAVVAVLLWWCVSASGAAYILLE